MQGSARSAAELGNRNSPAVLIRVSCLSSQREDHAVGKWNIHAEQRKRPLSEHVGEWEKSLKAKGNTEIYAEGQAKHVRAITQAGRFIFWPDLCADRIQHLIADMRKDSDDKTGISARTANAYLQGCKQFCNWMVRNDRAPNNPLSHLTRYNIKTDRRVIRRPLTFDECQRLITTAENGELIYGMTGPERAMLYRVALGTGFRAAELRSLLPSSFDLDSESPTVSVAAAYSKHRKLDIQPISRHLAELLKGFLADKQPGTAVFQPHSDKTADMLRADLEKAGIEPVDGTGNRVDFHALRHTFITLGAQAGIAPKVLMDLARHRTV